MPLFFFSGRLTGKAETIVFSRKESSGEELLLRKYPGDLDEIPISGQKSSAEEVVQSQKLKDDDGEVLQNRSVESAPESAETSVSPVNDNSGLTKTKIVLERGQTLRLLALELFENREFWVYIYLENKNSIPNPNIVPIGTELIMPDPSHYNITASDPLAVAKAKELGEKILASF